MLIAAAIPLASCSEDPVEQCLEARMAVWDHENPQGYEMVPDCPGGMGSIACSFAAEQGEVPLKQQPRVYEVEAVTSQCLREFGQNSR
jgi:hypothetical protein